MLARSAFAGLAAAFFLVMALTFVAPGAGVTETITDENGTVYTGGDVEGEPSAVAVTSAVRTLSAGLLLLSLALVDWSGVMAATSGRTGAARPGPADPPAA